MNAQSTNRYIYLSDFGLSAYIKNEKCKSFSGTGIYISPEIIGGKGHDEKTDYWSLGILAFILMTYEPPFFSEDKKTLFNLILKQNIDFTSYSYLSPSAVSFLQSVCSSFNFGSCLNIHPSIFIFPPIAFAKEIKR